MSVRTILIFAAILAGLIATRLCHSRIIWVEEAYPAAAAIQSADYGKIIYRDLWFDKPLGSSWFYRLFGARTGVPLRIAGAMYTFLCCLVIFGFARYLWTDSEGLAAAVALAWFLTFNEPAAVLAVAPDVAMILPHIVAAWLSWRGEWYFAGPAFAIGLWMNTKILLALPANLLAVGRGWFGWLFLFLLATIGVSLAAGDIWDPHLIQVWEWGRTYSADTFLTNPWKEGLLQTGEWMFFHLALVIGAGAAIARGGVDKRLLVWLTGSFIAVCLGLRFFPRYYLQLLPVMCLLAASGFVRAPKPWLRWLMLAALVIPLARFGPRYATLAADDLAGREHNWNALDLYYDSCEVAAALRAAANQPGEAPAHPTLFVWGYRPDIWMLTRLPAATRFLDSQPINGVFADRHLTSSRPSVSGDRLGEATANLTETSRTEPAFLVDGLGLLNPELALDRSPLWKVWAPKYQVLARTKRSIVYQRRDAGSQVQ